MSLHREYLIAEHSRHGKKADGTYRNSRRHILTPSLTEQAHKDDVSMQKILKKYQKTGIIQHTNAHQGEYMNMANAPSYQEAQNIIAHAKTVFESVPSNIRDAMGNDPQTFVDFMQNPENRDEIEAFGLDTSHLGERPTTPPQANNPETPATPQGPAETP